MKPADELNPADVQWDSSVTVQKCSDKQLRFHCPLLSKRSKVISIAMLPVAILLVIFLFGANPAAFMQAGDPVMDVVLVVVIASSVLSAGLFFLFGRITVDIDSQRLVRSFHLRFLGTSKTVPTDSIRSISLSYGAYGRSRDENAWFCKVRTDSGSISLSFLNDWPTAHTVARIVRYQLRRMGFLKPTE